MNAKELIARRVALELNDGDVVNLGIGLPTQVANYLPEGVHITLQSENGFLGLGPVTTPDKNLVNAGGQPCGILPGASMFDSAFSFALIRGGHVDASVLGGLQVDEQANLANWVVRAKWCGYGRCDGSRDRCTQSDHSHGALCKRRFRQNPAGVHHAADRRESGGCAGNGTGVIPL